MTTGIQWERLKGGPLLPSTKIRQLPQLLRLAPIDFTIPEYCAQLGNRCNQALQSHETRKRHNATHNYLTASCFCSSRGHTFQTRLTGSASVRQFDSADRRTTFRGFARLLKTPKSFNSISVRAARACRQCCCPAYYAPARRRLFLLRLLSAATLPPMSLASPMLVLRQPS